MVGVSGLPVGTKLSKTGVGTSICVTIAGCSFSLASNATLITNELFTKLKLGFTKLKDWINILLPLITRKLGKKLRLMKK